MAKTQQTKKKKKEEKQSQVMDGLNMPFEDAMKFLAQPEKPKEELKK